MRTRQNKNDLRGLAICGSDFLAAALSPRMRCSRSIFSTCRLRDLRDSPLLASHDVHLPQPVWAVTATLTNKSSEVAASIAGAAVVSRVTFTGAESQSTLSLPVELRQGRRTTR